MSVAASSQPNVHKFADLEHALEPITESDRKEIEKQQKGEADVQQTPGSSRALSTAAKKGLPPSKKKAKQRRRVHMSCPVMNEQELVADGGAPRSPQRQRRFGSGYLDLQQGPSTTTAVPYTPSQLRAIPGASKNVEDVDSIPRPIFAGIADAGLDPETEAALVEEMANLSDSGDEGM